MKRLLKQAEYAHCTHCSWDNGDFMYDDNNELFSWVPDPSTKKFKQLSENQIYKSRKEFDEKNPQHVCPKCGHHVNTD